mgnify:CR=1 FL=1
MKLCADHQCPSRKLCLRYTKSKKLKLSVFVRDGNACLGFIEAFPVKKVQNCVDNCDVIP